MQRRSISWLYWSLCFLAWALCFLDPKRGIAQDSPVLPQINSRRNVDEFPPVRAKAVRFNIFKTNRAEPCIDELEILTAEPEPRNVALASAGAKVSVSGSLPGYRIHSPANLNDGQYGNGHSWISESPGRGWVQIELPQPELINKVIWGRDREGKFIDRLVTEYSIELLLEEGQWKEVATSARRKPLDTGAEYFGINPGQRFYVNRFVPVSTTLPGDAIPSSLNDYTTTVWQTENGLPSNTISAIVQTRDGYIWLGTFNGLVRFDGVHFVVFGEAEGLESPRILCLYEDRSGHLWIGTEGGGLIRYRAGEFQKFTARDGLSNDVVLSIAEDKEGILWIGTLSGLSCLKNGLFVPPPGLQNVPVYRVLADQEGHAWFVAGYLYYLKDGQIGDPPVPDEPAKFTSLYSMHQGVSGSIWVGGANGYIVRLNQGNTTVFGKQQGLPQDIVWEMLEARNGDLWVGMASGGLCRLRDGKFTTFTTLDGLSDNSIRSICEDKEGNLWVGTNGGGLIRLQEKKLSTYTTRDGLSHDVIMSMAEDADGQIWIGSNCGGLNLWKDGVFTNYSVHYLLDNECIWSLCAARDGSTWIGTWGGGLFRKTGDKVTNFLAVDGLPNQEILALCEDEKGGLWIGTYSGGLKYYFEGTFKNYTVEDGLSANIVTSILEEAPGKIWIGTGGGGLNCLENGQIKTIRRKDGLASDFVRTLHLDAEGVLWIGTSGGLSRHHGGGITSFTRRHGLINEVISQILEDDYGNLWIGSNQGISRVRKVELHEVAAGRSRRVSPLSFGKAEGMESLECTGGFHPAGLKARDGSLWFSTVKGVVRVNPVCIRLNEVPPPVLLEQVLADGASIGPKSNDRTGLRIAPGVERLEFHFTALSFTAPEKVTFRYRMEGLDKEWIDGGNRRSAVYTHVPPGEYRFRVTALNNDGTWSDTPAGLALVILPPFWQTLWFRSLILLAGIGGIAGAVRYVSVRSMREKLLRLEQEHALEKERSRIARDIHDDLGAGLTQIMLLSDLGQQKNIPREEMARSFGQIAASAREIVQSMDAIVWAVNPRNDTLDHIANYLPHFAKDFLRSLPVRCRIDVPAILPDVPVSAEVRHNVILTVKEALNNVVKHSGASEVWLRLNLSNGGFTISVEDDGCGFDPLVAGRMANGNGLANMKKRLEEIGGTLELRSIQGCGTTVELKLELQPEMKISN